ncbi:CRISPR-associated protein Cas4 [Aneurinibacillus tyrosinisolvens]|uniref:CRISPR-associated protein Cas4 n=1 Tax=Aneurinibacillus tyrosinisolvens TaxID=1443435 RepID=UPI00063F2456|nr:CRISPR-associated protein Cas4 [Aneurinibacillus tyrosinisolvens]
MVNGIEIQYFNVCKRKLWLYSKQITMEVENDRVMEGKILHERSYQRLEQREMLIDNQFKIDAVDGEYIREVKISSKMAEADKWQLLFYLYELKLRGVNKKGLISYTKEKKTEEVILDIEKEHKLENMIKEIQIIRNQDYPPTLKKLPYCSKCAYFDFCFSDVEEDISC